MTFDQTRGLSATSVAVLGAGSWGTTFAKILADAATASGIERDIRLWGRREEVVEQINLKHRNEQYLKDIALPPSITASTDVAEVLAGAELVVLAVPAQTLRPITSPPTAALLSQAEKQAVLQNQKRNLGIPTNDIRSNAGAVGHESCCTWRRILGDHVCEDPR